MERRLRKGFSMFVRDYTGWNYRRIWGWRWGQWCIKTKEIPSWDHNNRVEVEEGGKEFSWGSSRSGKGTVVFSNTGKEALKSPEWNKTNSLWWLSVSPRLRKKWIWHLMIIETGNYIEGYRPINEKGYEWTEGLGICNTQDPEPECMEKIHRKI